MAIPDYQTVMLPLLRLLADGEEHALADAIEVLGSRFNLTTEERSQLLPSGRQPVFDNRVGWARTYMKKAGLIESTARGRFRITNRGLEVLKSNPSRIDVKLLTQFPEFIEFRTVSRKASAEEEPTLQEEEVETPEELLEASYQRLRRSLADDLLEQVKKSPPKFFERLVVDLLIAMGYGGSRKEAGRAIGRSGDDGVDGIINEDKLGLDVVYIQAKRWESSVGRQVVQAFAGSLEGQRARKGVLITTSHFTQDAKEYVNRIEKKIVLIDGEQLAQFMVEFGIGVTEVTKYEIKRVDLDYFDQE